MGEVMETRFTFYIQSLVFVKAPPREIGYLEAIEQAPTTLSACKHLLIYPSSKHVALATLAVIKVVSGLLTNFSLVFPLFHS